MGGIETFVILPVAAFHFAVMSGRIWTNQLVPDAVALQMCLEERRLVFVGCKAVGEFCSVVRLDAFYGPPSWPVRSFHGGRCQKGHRH